MKYIFSLLRIFLLSCILRLPFQIVKWLVAAVILVEVDGERKLTIARGL
jgi:hypothetical protein